MNIQINPKLTFNYFQKKPVNTTKNNNTCINFKHHPDFENLISINNTLGYILKSERNETIHNLCRLLKRDGILITDPEAEHLENAKIDACFKQLYEGIYLKKKYKKKGHICP